MALKSKHVLIVISILVLLMGILGLEQLELDYGTEPMWHAEHYVGRVMGNHVVLLRRPLLGFLGARRRLRAKSSEPSPLQPLIEPLVVTATMVEYHAQRYRTMALCR